MSRCKNGTRRNIKTGLCEKHVQSEKTVPKKLIKIKSERKRCENGTRKNKKTGICEKHTGVKKQTPEKSPIQKTPPKKIYNVTICEPTECVITTKSNKVNNYNVYKIKHDGCVRYFFLPDDNFNFVYLDNSFENTGVLVKRNTDASADKIEYIKTFLENNQQMNKETDFLTRNKIIRLQWDSSLCAKRINFAKKTKLNLKLKNLNDLLKAKCDKLSLSLDYIYNMNGDVVSYDADTNILLLCLNHPEKGCISSVELLISYEHIGINSRTKPEFEGKKYNKLLRAATIIIAPLIGCENLSSFSINPISTWLLMDSFNATTNDEEVIEFLFKKRALKSKNPDQIITKHVFTKELIQKYHKNGEVDLEIDLTNKANIENAEKVFSELINTPNLSKQIKCK